MRYSADHKSETHKRIVTKAAKQFRLRGLDGVGIASLMGDLGLTHGGFYAHFKDKHALIDEASLAAVNEQAAKISRAMDAAPSDKPLKLLLDYYLSPAHRDDVAEGCVLPALASEIARRPSADRRKFTRALEAVFDQIARGMPGETPKLRKERALAFFAGMVGSVVLSRAVADPQLSNALLEAMHKSLTREVEKAGG